MLANFTLEQRTGEQPHYVHKGKDPKIEIYYGEPPLAPRGIYVLLSVTGSDKVFRVLVRQLDHFDAIALAAVADNFHLE